MPVEQVDRAVLVEDLDPPDETALEPDLIGDRTDDVGRLDLWTCPTSMRYVSIRSDSLASIGPRRPWPFLPALPAFTRPCPDANSSGTTKIAILVKTGLDRFFRQSSRGASPAARAARAEAMRSIGTSCSRR